MPIRPSHRHLQQSLFSLSLVAFCAMSGVHLQAQRLLPQAVPNTPPSNVRPQAPADSTNSAGSIRLASGVEANPKPAGNSSTGEQFEPGRVLALVAGQPVFASDLLLTINEVIQTQAADAPPFVRQKMLEQGMRELLPRSIERKMMYQEALLQLPPSAKLDDIKKDLYKQVEEKQLPQLLKKYEATNLSQLDARLRSLGSSWRALREQIVEQEIAKYAIMSQLNVDQDVAFDQLRNWYRKNLESYRIQQQARWEHLMVSYSKTPDRAEAKKKLVAMGNEVYYGANFAEVAKRSSDDFFASSGGYNDWTKRGGLTNRKLEEHVFSEPVGRLSDIIETDFGVHIIRVIERQEDGYIPFPDVQDKIREEILDERQGEAVKKLIEKMKSRIPTEILLDGVEF